MGSVAGIVREMAAAILREKRISIRNPSMEMAHKDTQAMNRGLQSYRKACKGWIGLMVPRFKCGHERNEANSYVAWTGHGYYARCKFCHNARRKCTT